MAGRQAALFAALHGRGGKLLVVVVTAKIALIIVAFFLLEPTDLHLSLGVLVLLLHAGVVALLVLTLWRSISRHRSWVSTARPLLHEGARPSAIGILLHSARFYDVAAWLFTLGRERAFRETILRSVRLMPGEAVLDVGCGTGTTAILAKRQVGSEGRVEGIDASTEMVARAASKAARAQLRVGFKTSLAQNLPYDAQEFDVVLSTLMFHHLPRAGRQAFAAEAYRVLKPGGRILVVDFTKRPEQETLTQVHRHGHVDMKAVADAFSQSSFQIVEQGDLGSNGLSYLVAKREEH